MTRASTHSNSRESVDLLRDLALAKAAFQQRTLEMLLREQPAALQSGQPEHRSGGRPLHPVRSGDASIQRFGAGGARV